MSLNMKTRWLCTAKDQMTIYSRWLELFETNRRNYQLVPLQCLYSTNTENTPDITPKNIYISYF